jgi:hypothetical protein
MVNSRCDRDHRRGSARGSAARSGLPVSFNAPPATRRARSCVQEFRWLRRNEATSRRCMASPYDRRPPVNNRKKQARGGIVLVTTLLLREIATRRLHHPSIDIGPPSVFKTLLLYIQKGLSQITFRIFRSACTQHRPKRAARLSPRLKSLTGSSVISSPLGEGICARSRKGTIHPIVTMFIELNAGTGY